MSERGKSPHGGRRPPLSSSGEETRRPGQTPPTTSSSILRGGRGRAQIAPRGRSSSLIAPPLPVGRGRARLLNLISSSSSGGGSPLTTPTASCSAGSCAPAPRSSPLIRNKPPVKEQAKDDDEDPSKRVSPGTILKKYTIQQDEEEEEMLNLENVRIVADEDDDLLLSRGQQGPPPPMTPTKVVLPPPIQPQKVERESPKKEDEAQRESGGGPPIQALYYRGDGGKNIDVTSNYMKLKLEEGRGVYEYLVTFSPRIDHRDTIFKLMGQIRDVTGPTKSFDGRKLYLPKKFDEEKIVKEVVNPNTNEKVSLTLSFVRECELGDRSLIQLYNILFNRIMKILKFVEHNRKYYNPHTAHSIPAHKLQVWPGYVNVVDAFEGGLLLQCDVSHRVLRTESVRDVLVDLGKKGGNVKIEAEKALLGVSVLTRYNNKTYKIDDLDFESSPKSTFTNERGEEVSYMDYYKRQYSITIKDHNQPLLIHRAKKKSVNEAEVTKLICLIPELCMMTGMTDAMRSDFKVMKEVGNFTRASPGIRRDSIIKFVKSVYENPEAAAQLSGWGLKLAPFTVPITARILPSETLHFGKGYKEVVNPKGDWGRAATSKNVLTPVPLTKWAIVFTDKCKTTVQSFCKIMQQQGPRMGIPISNPKVISVPNDRTETYLKAMRDVIDPTVQLVLTVVPQLKSDRYAAIKKLACVEKPVASQVVNLKTISNEKRLSSVVQKVILQINAKLGGELWAVTTPHKDLMVVGIDVYNDKSRGNIVGMVTSLNDGLSRYFSNVNFVNPGQNLMDCLKVSFMEALVKYFEINHKWPKSIVVFRDGVGDGQLDIVDKYEAQQFMDAFSAVEHKNITIASGGSTGNTSSSLSGYSKKLAQILPANYKPSFNYVVVQKRINTRVFVKKPGGGANDYENPMPGTIVDHTVTRKFFKDFFLVPQAVNQGTVTPTHFVVVRDESKLGVNDVQKLAYKLTHMYYNWPGTVRVPAPCQYAHKLVDLVGEHIHKQPSPGLLDKLYYL